MSGYTKEELEELGITGLSFELEWDGKKVISKNARFVYDDEWDGKKVVSKNARFVYDHENIDKSDIPNHCNYIDLH